MESRPARRFKEVGVGNAACQPAWKRFGENVDEATLPERANLRMGLTALSQKYNLYFTAYGDEIHVTVPRDVRQTMNGVPDLKIALPKSSASYRVRPHIDWDKPHHMNSLIVANLGSLEIILVACDDGDILAYYTHLIDQEIAKHTLTTPGRALDSQAKPILHENVGISAWGLAVHDKSRLIAVSSNAAEVTIFAFALSTDGWQEETPPGLLSTPEKFASQRKRLFERISKPPQSALHGREGGYRMVFNMRPRGHNIPAISFANDLEGNASTVLAVDILGKMWKLNLWEGTISPPQMRICTGEGIDVTSWSVLVIPFEAFRLEPVPPTALGVPNVTKATFAYEPTSQDGMGPSPSRSIVFDISKSLEEVRDPTLRESAELELEETDPPRPSPVVPNSPPSILQTHAMSPGAGDARPPPTPILSFATPELARPQENVVSERATETSGRTELEYEKGLKPIISYPPNAPQPFAYHLADGSAILRTFKCDIELLSPSKTNPTTTCSDVFAEQVAELREEIAMVDRLNMVTCIPELSLVVVATAAGFASLITLTRLKASFTPRGPLGMFRLDYILPFKKHRHCCPPQLYGMAVSPVHTGQPKGTGPRRWRLLLHYFDFRILSYELYRDEDDNLLII